MKVKIAKVTFELVDESSYEPDEKIKRELFRWFRKREAYIPWIKDVKDIKVKDKRTHLKQVMGH